MAETVDFTYRAFLSYAHADSVWAKRLHKRLEGFRIDKDLVGRATEMGPVPSTLRPIFRDREDFSGGHALTDATVTALDRSAALIVLCSPTSARSHYVNEEVRLFRSRHPNRPVIPVIIEGTFPENFPPALRYAMAADGTVTDRPVTLLGPDLTEARDGRELGLAKAVAALIGVPADDVRKRQAIAESRRIKIAASGVAVFAVLALVAVFLYWQHERQLAQTAERDRVLRGQLEEQRKQMEAQNQQLAALAQRLSLIAPAWAAGTEKAIGEAVKDAAKGAGQGDDRLQRALDLLDARKVKDAAELFRAVAEEKSSRLSRDKQDVAAAYRNLGAIAGLADPKAAREAYAKALEFDPDDLESLYWHGYLSYWAGDLAASIRSLDRLLQLASARGDQRGIQRAHVWLGKTMMDRADLVAAAKHEEMAVAIALRRSTGAPEDTEWKRDLSEAQIRLGEVLVAQGNLQKALESNKASLVIRERLAKANPGNAGWQRDLSVSHIKIGDVLRAQGNLPAALESHRASLAIAERLAKADPGNAGWQRDLSVSQERVGVVLVEQSNLVAALESYLASLAIRERLAKTDPANAGWQRDLSLSQEKIADVLVEQSNRAAALESYRASLVIRERLAKADPGNAEWQRILSVSHNKIGDVLRAQGNLPAALENYKASLAIAERLAKTDPGNAEWQHDVALSLQRVGLVASQQGHKEDARDAYRRGREIMQRLTAIAPDHAAFKRDLAWFEARLSQR